MKKIIYILLTCEKYQNRQDNVLKTWGQNKNVFFYSEHEDKSRNVIKVCDENLSDYGSITLKQKFIFEKLEELFYNDYEWFFFGDDDTFVNTSLLESDLDTFDKTKVIGLDYSMYWNGVTYASGGAGMVINREIISKFFKYNEGPFGCGGEKYPDITFGYNMQFNNVLLDSSPLFNGEHPTHYGVSLDNCKTQYTYHRIHTLEEMEYMNNLCQ